MNALREKGNKFLDDYRMMTACMLKVLVQLLMVI